LATCALTICRPTPSTIAEAHKEVRISLKVYNKTLQHIFRIKHDIV